MICFNVEWLRLVTGGSLTRRPKRSLRCLLDEWSICVKENQFINLKHGTEIVVKMPLNYSYT